MYPKVHPIYNVLILGGVWEGQKVYNHRWNQTRYCLFATCNTIELKQHGLLREEADLLGMFRVSLRSIQMGCDLPLTEFNRILLKSPGNPLVAMSFKLVPTTPPAGVGSCGLWLCKILILCPQHYLSMPDSLHHSHTHTHTSFSAANAPPGAGPVASRLPPATRCFPAPEVHSLAGPGV